jgi:predicted Zn-dependent protease
VAVALLLAGAACAPSSPASKPRPKPVVLSAETDDERAGAELAREVREQLGVLDAPALQAYVQALGVRLARHAPERRFAYTVQVVDPWPPNAFALPGGYVYLTRGVLALANDEDELAAVIAHELAHAALRHQAALQRALPSHPFALAFVSPAWVAAYQRDQERAADRAGQAIAGAAGYDPAGLERFLRSLGRAERLLGASARVPGFFDTHPPTAERAAAAGDAAGRVARGPASAEREAEAYLRRIEGLVVGPNPAEGFFDGSRFVHPDLGFAIRFPARWTLVNTPSAVGALDPGGYGRVALELAGAGDDPKPFADAFAAERGPGGRARIQVEEAHAFALNGLPAFELRGEADGVRGRVLWAALGGNVYRISSASGGVGSKRAATLAQIAARSFRPLAAEEAAGVTVERLRVALAFRGETLEALARRTGSAWDANAIAVANGLSGSEPLERGRFVKIAVREPYRGAGARAPGAAGAPR